MSEGGEGHQGPLAGARALVGAALAALEASRERLDDLNVYPVPDGDTGTNMTLTVRAVRDTLAGSSAATREHVAKELARAALMGARGNSGVILSQLVRGATDVLGEDTDLGRALRAASDAGYAAVREPQEGTILTVARALAERAEALRGEPLGDALGALVAHGEEAVAATRDQLDVLREAGVVDAGGAGLLEVVRGIAAHVRGEPLPDAPAYAAAITDDAVHQELSRFRYCTSFFVEGEKVDPAALERELGRLGDSLLVVGGPGAVKIHVHTDEPGRALALGTAVGVLDHVDVKNMHQQIADREVRLTGEPAEAGRTGVVAVAAGAGNAALFASLGAARVVEGGQTMNPPTSELLAALEGVAGDEVLILPNNRNVLLAAEQAASESSRPALVVPTETMQAGMAALLAFDPARAAGENAAEMSAAARRVRAGAVTRASRTATVDGVAVHEGEYLGLVDGRAVAAGPELDPVADAVLARLLADPADVLTIHLGDGVADPAPLRERVATAHPALEIEVVDGGQPHYPLLFGAE